MRLWQKLFMVNYGCETMVAVLLPMCASACVSQGRLTGGLAVGR